MLHSSHLPQLSGLGKMIRRRSVEYGDLIKSAREKAGLTQHQLGAKAGISLSLIAQWERVTDRKRPSLFNLEKVCKALGITVFELFTNADDGGSNLTDLEDEVLFLLRKLDREQQRAFLTVLRSKAVR